MLKQYTEVGVLNKYMDPFYKMVRLLIKNNYPEFLQYYKQKRKLFNLIFATFSVTRISRMDAHKWHSEARALKRIKNRNHDKTIMTKYHDIENMLQNKDLKKIRFISFNQPDIFVSYFTRIVNALDINDVKQLVQDIVETKLNTLQQIKLANVCLSRINRANHNISTQVYLLPVNNSMWVETSEITQNSYAYSVLADIFIDSIRSIMNDVNISYPKQYETFKVPTTQNKKIGMGSYIQLSDNMDMLRSGIYWENNDSGQTDIDISATFQTTNTNNSFLMSWNQRIRSANIDAYFSGDMTDAPNGAAEFIEFSLDKAQSEIDTRYVIIHVSYFDNIPKNGLFGIQYIDTPREGFKSGTKAHKIFNPTKMIHKLELQEQVSSNSTYTPVIIDVREKRVYILNTTINNLAVASYSKVSSVDLVESFMSKYAYSLSISDIFDNTSEEDIDESTLVLKDYNQLYEFMLKKVWS
jgi:hypothetical protein